MLSSFGLCSKMNLSFVYFLCRFFFLKHNHTPYPHILGTSKCCSSDVAMTLLCCPHLPPQLLAFHPTQTLYPSLMVLPVRPASTKLYLSSPFQSLDYFIWQTDGAQVTSMAAHLFTVPSEQPHSHSLWLSNFLGKNQAPHFVSKDASDPIWAP